jgi:hypothetical protein
MSMNIRPSQSSATEVMTPARSRALHSKKRRRQRATKGYRIGGRYVLLVAGRKVIGQEGDFDVSLANK